MKHMEIQEDQPMSRPNLTKTGLEKSQSWRGKAPLFWPTGLFYFIYLGKKKDLPRLLNCHLFLIQTMLPLHMGTNNPTGY